MTKARAKASTSIKPRRSAAVGQIGLGIMGGSFAKHLLGASFEVMGFDPQASRAAELARLGGSPQRSIAAVARRCPIMITSLPSVRAAEGVFLGPGGIAEAGLRGTIVIEASTLPLEVKNDVAKRCAASGITVLDCPISGTGAQAASGDVAVYASGQKKGYTAIRPVLDAMARSVHYCGVFGNGSKLKFIANLLVTIHNVSTAEAIVMGRRSGLDLDLLYRVIADGAGSSRMFQVRAPLMIRREYRQPTIKVEVYQKDLDIIEAYAGALRCPTPLFNASKAFYTAARAHGMGDSDTAAVCAVLEYMAATAEDTDADAPRMTRRRRRTEEGE